MTTLEILTAARALVARGWCQGDSARDFDGNPVDPYSRQAQKWCVAGAILASGFATGGAFGHVLSLVNTDVDLWNDRPERTQSDVLDLFDRAIELARKEQTK